MKLINSLTEHKIKEALIHSNQWLFGSEEGSKVISILEKSVGTIWNAYILRFIFDEDEETYFYLVNGNTVVELEVTWEHNEKNTNTAHTMQVVECRNVREYKLAIKRKDDILTLLIALKLSKEAISHY